MTGPAPAEAPGSGDGDALLQSNAWMACNRCYEGEAHYIHECGHLLCQACHGGGAAVPAASTTTTLAECSVCSNFGSFLYLGAAQELPDSVERIFVPVINQLEDCVKVYRFQQQNFLRLHAHLRDKVRREGEERRVLETRLNQASARVHAQQQRIHQLEQEVAHLKRARPPPAHGMSATATAMPGFPLSTPAASPRLGRPSSAAGMSPLHARRPPPPPSPGGMGSGPLRPATSYASPLPFSARPGSRLCRQPTSPDPCSRRVHHVVPEREGEPVDLPPPARAPLAPQPNPAYPPPNSNPTYPVAGMGMKRAMSASPAMPEGQRPRTAVPPAHAHANPPSLPPPSRSMHRPQTAIGSNPSSLAYPSRQGASAPSMMTITSARLPAHVPMGRAYPPAASSRPHTATAAARAAGPKPFRSTARQRFL